MERERIKKTLDAKALKRGIIVRIVLYFLLILYFSLKLMLPIDEFRGSLITFWILTAVVYTLAFIPMIVMISVEYIKLMKNAPRFIPVDCYLKESRVKGLRSYFIVELKHENKRITGETNAIFGEYSIHANVGEYIHKWVKAAYDPETGAVLVFPINDE